MSDQSQPPESDLPPLEAHSSAGGLLGEDTVAIAMAKFSALESFINLLTRDLKFTDFMREILLVFMRVIRSEAGSILEMDYANKTIFFRTAAGRSSEAISHFVIPMGQGIVGHVAESKQPLIVSNVSENRNHLKAIEKAVGFETRNLVAIPIIVRGQVFAVLELLNRQGEDNYSEEDLEVLKYLCETAGKTIEIRMMIAWAARQKLNSSGEAA